MLLSIWKPLPASLILLATAIRVGLRNLQQKFFLPKRKNQACWEFAPFLFAIKYRKKLSSMPFPSESMPFSYSTFRWMFYFILFSIRNNPNLWMCTSLLLVCRSTNLRQQLSKSFPKQSLCYIFVIHNSHHMIPSCFIFQKEVACSSWGRRKQLELFLEMRSSVRLRLHEPSAT